jgi:membrane protein
VTFVRIIGRGFVDFFRDGGVMLAGSLSYFVVMTLFPLCLFLIALFGRLLGQYPEFYQFVLSRLAGVFPRATSEISGEIVKLTSAAGIGLFSLLLYGILSFSVFSSVERSLNVIFKVGKKRHFFFSFLLSIAMVTVIMALLIFSFVTASLVPLLSLLKPLLPGLKIGALSKFLIRFVIPFVLVSFFMTAIYVLIPKTKVRVANALKGGLFAAVLMEISKHVFTWYVMSIAPLGRIYGPITAFIVFLLWIFYSSSIFLIGGEIVHNLSIRKGTRELQVERALRRGRAR